MNELKFFATDEGKENLVIFEANIEDAPNAYFWVTLPYGRKKGKANKRRCHAQEISGCRRNYSDRFQLVMWISIMIR